MNEQTSDQMVDEQIKLNKVSIFIGAIGSLANGVCLFSDAPSHIPYGIFFGVCAASLLHGLADLGFLEELRDKITETP